MTESKAIGFIKLLDSRGEDSVRASLSCGEFGDLSDASNWRVASAKSWLELKDKTLDRSIAKKALSIANEANRIASEDLAIARASARWAMWAAIIAMLAAIISTKEQILEIIFGASL